MFKSCCVCVGKKVIENHQDSIEVDESNDKEENFGKESVKIDKPEQIINGSVDLLNTDDKNIVKENGNSNQKHSTGRDSSSETCLNQTHAFETMDENATTVSATNINGSAECDDKKTKNNDDLPEGESRLAHSNIDGKSKKFTHKREKEATHNDIQEAVAEESDDEDSEVSPMQSKNVDGINDILLYQGTARRASSGGILKRPSIGWPADEKKGVSVRTEVSDDDEVFCSPPSSTLLALRKQSLPAGLGGGAIGRDELAMRRHRVFSELVGAARAAAEHRVRFDPLGPAVASGAEQTTPQVPSADLEKLLDRLERVVTRLERVAGVAPSPPYPPPPPPPEDTSSITEESGSPTSPNVDGNLLEDLNNRMSVQGYQDILQGSLAQYVALSNKIGGDVAAHAGLVQKAFNAQLQFLTTASQAAQPSSGQLQSLLSPTSLQIQSIQEFREKNRVSPLFNHLSAISESIPALGWVAVSPTPAPYVKEMNDAGQFYTNRVLKDWKEKDKTHVEWCKAWVQTLQELQAFVKQFHTTGLVWGGKGGVPPPPPAGGMPPPPPCPPPVCDFGDAPPGSDDRSALFAQINQGQDITKSLKKVTSDMQTHKNTALREGPAPFKAQASGPKPFSKALPTPGAGQIDKPPVFSRDGKKWIIEHQKGNSGLLVENAEMNNVIYMFKCKDSSLTVKGKVNSIFLDSCTKCAVVFDNLVSSVEFVNCQSVQMQVLGKVPTISIDKTDGCQMYLSPDSIDVEIVSSKSSEMNVLLPKGNGDYVEMPIPEQFKTTVNKPSSSLVTVAVENKG